MTYSARGFDSPDAMTDLRGWFHESPGQDLMDLESACLERMLPDLFGYYLLQVGMPGGYGRIVELSRIRHHVLVRDAGPVHGDGIHTVGTPAQLPVASDSIDVVFLPHTLDFTEEPHQVLREAERVLIPEGRLILFGFNPWSLWGLSRVMRGSARGMPWCGSFVSPFRVIDWLSLLGFDVEQQEPMMFRPPLRRPALMRRLLFLDQAGLALWPAFAGAYAIRAVKRVSTLTPIRPSWSVRAKVVPGRAVEPTTRWFGRG